MAAKLIVNQTPFLLSGTLTVRNGDEPEDGNYEEVGFEVEPNNESMIDYGDSSNPYLNGFSCQVQVKEDFIYYQENVSNRGDGADGRFNTRDTFIIFMAQNQLIMDTSNGWA